MWSCTSEIKEDIDITSRTIPIVENVSPDYNMSYTRGSLEIMPTEREIVLNLTGVAYSSNGDYSDRVMVIQQNGNHAKLESVIAEENAELLLFKHGILVVLKSQDKKILFALGEEQISEKAEKFLDKVPNSFVDDIDNSYFGFGVAMMPSKISSLEEYVKTHSITFYETDDELRRKGEEVTRNVGECANCSTLQQCQCGGPGASSCSCGGASVSCNSPCLACCNSTGGANAKCCSSETVPQL